MMTVIEVDDEKPDFFFGDLGTRLRELLEDFEIIATPIEMALVSRRYSNNNLSDNIRAAVIASSMRLASIDYARKRYLRKPEKVISKEMELLSAYLESYKSLKLQIERITNDNKTSVANEESSAGTLFARVALLRLKSTFFSAHLLYELGNIYEGHAVARIILEQIAWAYVVSNFDDTEKIKKIKPNDSVSNFKQLMPDAGRLYGLLSQKTHLDIASHHEFLRIRQNQLMILHSQPQSRLPDYAKVLLDLTDMYTVVWEITQHETLANLEAVERVDNRFVLKMDRPFWALRNKHLQKLVELCDAT